MQNNIRGLNHLYDPETKETYISWSYVDSDDLDYFVIEVYDENKREWVPYDNHMGIVKKNT